MIAFYSTTLDGITYVASAYSYKNLRPNEEPNKFIRVLWSILFIIFPIALLFSENTLYSLQSVTIIAAFPVGILLILVVWAFIKDINQRSKSIS
jgi:BCCT family betaine/carnitine transporter